MLALCHSLEDFLVMTLLQHSKPGLPMALGGKVFNVPWQNEKTKHFTPRNARSTSAKSFIAVSQHRNSVGALQVRKLWGAHV